MPHDVAAESLGDLGALAQSPTIARALDAVREFLDMEVAYTSEIVDDRQALRELSGDRESFHLVDGGALPLEETYCHRVMTGRLPNLLHDVQNDPRTADMLVTRIANVGAFATVPLTFSDGTVHGTLCAASHDAKPSLGYRELQFLHVFARLIADQIERDRLLASKRDLELQAAAAQTLIAAVEARDAYTGEHSQAVVEHAAAVARRLVLSADEIADVKHVALLHDIGKISIPDAILRKPGKLTAEEWEVMREHPVLSERLIRNVPGLEHLAPAIRGEHERWDGSGYPDGLVGEEIPVASRITLVCDAYHAMTSDRPYRRALAQDVAHAEVLAGAGTQFCPRAAAALIEVLDEKA
jgi:response regulator RpfG family c-di-GMP phosphodiesterase